MRLMMEKMQVNSSVLAQLSSIVSAPAPATTSANGDDCDDDDMIRRRMVSYDFLFLL